MFSSTLLMATHTPFKPSHQALHAYELLFWLTWNFYGSTSFGVRYLIWYNGCYSSQYGFGPKMHIAMCNMDSCDQKWRLKLRRRRHLWSVRDWVFFTSNTRVPWNVFDQVCSFGLEVSNFFIALCMLRFFIAICILRRVICVQYAYCDAI